MDTLIIAGNKHEANNYVRKHNTQNPRLISGPEQLMGMQNVKIILIGTYYKRKDWDRLLSITITNNIDIRKG